LSKAYLKNSGQETCNTNCIVIHTAVPIIHLLQRNSTTSYLYDGRNNNQE